MRFLNSGYFRIWFYEYKSYNKITLLRQIGDSYLQQIG